MQRINGMRYKAARKVIAELNTEIGAWQELKAQQAKYGFPIAADAERTLKGLVRRRDDLLLLPPETLVCIDV